MSCSKICYDVDGSEIKVGDTVEVVDDRGNSALVLGSKLTVSSIREVLPVNRFYIEFEDSTAGLYPYRVRKVNKNRHPHADLIHKWAEDTSLEVEYYDDYTRKWFSDTTPVWYSKCKFRIKHTKSPEELEKESILASIKELEESTSSTLSELHSKLKSLGN